MGIVLKREGGEGTPKAGRRDCMRRHQMALWGVPLCRMSSSVRYEQDQVTGLRAIGKAIFRPGPILAGLAPDFVALLPRWILDSPVGIA